MLTPIQTQAILRCLGDLDTHLQRHSGWDGPPLLATLTQTPVIDHPDPSAQFLGVNPLPVPDDIWAHPDGVTAGLRLAAGDLQKPLVQDQLASAPGDLRLLAWVFVHTEHVTDSDLGPVWARIIEAVDVDGLTYNHIHLSDEPVGSISVAAIDPAADSDTTAILRALARSLRTG